MTRAIETAFQEAMQLNPVERAELIEELYRSFDPSGDRRIDALWAKEAESRIDAFDAGLLKADSADAVLQRINKR